MRLTIDLDNPSNLSIQKCYYNLWNITKIQPQLRISSSKKGVHLKVHGLINNEELITSIRKTLGDDEVRVKFDTERIAKPKQVLWTVKDGKKSGEWTHDIDLIIATIGKTRTLFRGK